MRKLIGVMYMGLCMILQLCIRVPSIRIGLLLIIGVVIIGVVLTKVLLLPIILLVLFCVYRVYSREF